jgi:hypothetical protein
MKMKYHSLHCQGPCICLFFFFNAHGFVHCELLSIIVQQDVTVYSLLYFCKLFYMFWVVTPLIFRSTYKCNYSIWHWSDFGKCGVCEVGWRWEACARPCYLPQSRKVAEAGTYLSSSADFTHTAFSEVWPVPDAVITFICAPDDGWSYHLKHVEEFTEM